MDINIVKKLKHISLNMFKKILFSLTAVAIVISIYLIFFVAPVPVDPMDAGGDPINFKIFYFHVPIAVTAYLAFAVVFVSGIMYLRTKGNMGYESSCGLRNRSDTCAFEFPVHQAVE